MPSYPRRQQIDESVVGVYHCWNRCVRQKALFGKNPRSGKDRRHRKKVIRDRLEALASVFAVEVQGLGVMPNHLHTVLCNRPDIAAGWSDREVARRWLRVTMHHLALQKEPSAQQVDEVLAIPGWVAERRKRLSSISWFQKALAEPLARRFNFEDEKEGHFWEARFKCRRILDVIGLLIVALYVDLNEIRANLAKTPEESEHTSAGLRIQDRRLLAQALAEGLEFGAPHAGWLAPIPDAGDGYLGVAAGRRVSDRGSLPIDLDTYLLSLDWVGRQVVEGKPGAIPAELPDIFTRLGIEPQEFSGTVVELMDRFPQAIGRPAAMRAEAERRSQNWLAGIRASRRAFPDGST